MKLAIVLSAVVLLLVGCKPSDSADVAAVVRADSLAIAPVPIKASPVAPKGFKAVGELTVPFFNDFHGRPVFSPDGKWIAAAGYGWMGERLPTSGLVFLWDARTRILVKKLAIPKEDAKPLSGLVWSPDGKQIAAWPSTQGLASSVWAWDVASGALLYGVQNQKLTAYSACFVGNRQLLISWFDNSDVTTRAASITLERAGKREEQWDLVGRSVTFIPRRSGPPLALVVETIGKNSVGEPLAKSSLCVWENARLGEPLIEFAKAEAMLFPELSFDEQTVVLSGVKQNSNTSPDGIDALYAVCDLSTREILWRAPIDSRYFSDVTSISADGKQFWAQTDSLKNQLQFNTRTGAFIPQKGAIPFFSPNGKRALRRVAGNRGQKPNLSAFHVFEK